MLLDVTDHAIARYVERVGGSQEAARAALSSHAVQVAADFGAQVVRLPHHRIILQFAVGRAVVITVLEVAGHVLPPQLRTVSHGGLPPVSQSLAALTRALPQLVEGTPAR